MNTLMHGFLALGAAALLSTAPQLSKAEQVPIQVADYTVFVDPPSRFVFVKLPSGWKFVGQVDTARLGSLPAGVVTSLLSPERDDDNAAQLAAHGRR
jgi:hypothetical protein